MTGRARRLMVTMAVAALVISACADTDTADSAPTTEVAAPVTAASGDDRASSAMESGMEHGEVVEPRLLAPAYLGASAFQDVEVAEAAGWVSTIDTLGCFENAEEGGMGVHWLNEALLDDELDPGPTGSARVRARRRR